MKTTGYRYSKDENGTIYIIELIAEDEQPGSLYEGDYKSENCVCVSITDVNTGEKIEQGLLCGIHGKYVKYKIGERIPGMCWFMHTKEQLSWLYKDSRTGEIYESFFIYRELEHMMRNCYKLQPEEVANELQISAEELWRRIRILNAGIKEEEQWGYPILAAMQKISGKERGTNETNITNEL